MSHNKRWNMYMPIDEVGRYVDAAVAELANNEHARRMSYNRWEWTNKQSAEEFITLFTLKYAQ